MTEHDVAADIRWLFNYAEGEMGLKSNFASMVAQLEGGGFHQSASYEMDERAISAARRAREVGQALQRCAGWAAVVLGLAFRCTGGEQRLTCALVSAAQAHKLSKSRRELPDWLEKQRRSKDQTKNRTWAKLRAEAQGLIREASLEYIDAFTREKETA